MNTTQETVDNQISETNEQMLDLEEDIFNADFNLEEYVIPNSESIDTPMFARNDDKNDKISKC